MIIRGFRVSSVIHCTITNQRPSNVNQNLDVFYKDTHQNIKDNFQKQHSEKNTRKCTEIVRKSLIKKEKLLLKN